MAIKVAFVSLGCPKNQIDTEIMLAKLLDEGFEFVEEDIEADVVVINTCAFIQEAKEEAIENILDVAWLKKNRQLKGIVVTGCFAQRYPEDIVKDLPEVDAVVGVGDLDRICDAVRAAYEKGSEKFVSVSAPESQKLGGDRVITTPEYTAYLKIAEGCDNRCSYCAIPDIRGAFRSRPMEDIIDEAKTLYSLGVKELCIVAQDTTRYGLDLYGKYALAELVEKLCTSEEFSFKWIRLMYCYPDKITDELVEVMAKYDCVVKYIDLPIQHIDDKILSGMNRHGTSDDIKAAIKKLRDKMPDITIRTTVIVGFPGENGTQFENLADFVKEARFERLGVFPYSREEGTVAYSMKNQVSKAKKQERQEIISEIQYQINYEHQQNKVGSVIEVLCEQFDAVAECYCGRSAADAPEVDTKVFFSASRKVEPGEFVKVKIEEVMEYDLLGSMED
ncbi:MAG: 30S ribosomal protein S12 methylthiotransferase RimO [Ruminococcaceae bacterium]|nr:30S ribosomal protein S12 methylthiotransferase RimO [Oscillospiraceae bacterium]